MLERSISRVRELEAVITPISQTSFPCIYNFPIRQVLASPSCPCSPPPSSFLHPLPSSSSPAAPDAGTMGEYVPSSLPVTYIPVSISSGRYDGPDQHTQAQRAIAASAEAEAAAAASREKDRAEAEMKRVQAAKQLARATCNPPPHMHLHSSCPPSADPPCSLCADTRCALHLPHQRLPPPRRQRRILHLRPPPRRQRHVHAAPGQRFRCFRRNGEHGCHT